MKTGEDIVEKWMSSLSEEDCELVDKYLAEFVEFGFNKAKEKTSYNGHPVDKYWTVHDIYKDIKTKGDKL